MSGWFCRADERALAKLWPDAVKGTGLRPVTGVTLRLEEQDLAYSSTEGPSAAGLQYGCSKRDRTGQADPAFYLQIGGCPTGLEPATFGTTIRDG